MLVADVSETERRTCPPAKVAKNFNIKSGTCTPNKKAKIGEQKELFRAQLGDSTIQMITIKISPKSDSRAMKNIVVTKTIEHFEEYCVLPIEADKSKTLKGFYESMADVLEFPDYFGFNLDSLEELLVDLSWLDEPKIAIWVQDSDLFVSKERNHEKIYTLIDLEFGYKFNRDQVRTSLNFYNMAYKNQLVLTGAVNDVGEAIRSNVNRSFRRGIELETHYFWNKKWQWSGNLTLSNNKIIDFDEVVADYDGNPNRINKYKKTDISFSPNSIVGCSVSYFPTPSLEMALLSKFVGKQFLDNTSSENKKIDPYFLNNVRINFTPQNTGSVKNFTVSLLVNNILNHPYENNGYTYSYIYDKTLSVNNFYYPQAGIHFILGLSFRY
jgi:RNAse (barnase) inhibitor barstar